MDEETVQQETTSTEETTSPEAKKEATTEQPLTPQQEARIQQLVAEATQQAVNQGKELGRREMQGIKDKEVARIERERDLAQRRAKAYESGLGNLDEESRAQLESRRLQEENSYYQTKEQEELARRQQEEYFQRLDDLRQSHLKRHGVDPKDDRIDWGNAQDDFITGWDKFADSVSKIVKDDIDRKEVGVIQKAEQMSQEKESALRKEYGVDSQDTTAGAGVQELSDADFMSAYGNYDIADTEENRKRYEQIKSKYY